MGQSLFPKNVCRKFIEYVTCYEDGKISYSELMRGVTEEYPRGMEGVSVAAVQDASRIFSESQQEQGL